MKILSLLNCGSLNKTLKNVPDILDQAKVKIFCIIFLLNYPKIAIQTYDHIASENYDLLGQPLFSFTVTTIILKLLLSRPNWVNALIHAVQILMLASIIRVANKYGIDVLIMQHVFMLIVFSFYGLGRKWGVVYSLANIGFIISFLISSQSGVLVLENTRYDNYSLYIFNIIINFLVIAISHYYFHGVLYGTIEQKKILTEKLQKTAKSKTDFLSTMSHELRTPLNAVIGMSNILMRDNSNKLQQENLNILKFSAENLLSLINNILDFNKIETENIELEKLTFNIDELFNKLGGMLNIQAQEKNLALFISTDETIKKQNIIGDPTRLSQILLNIASNSVKFTQKGSVNLSAETLQEDEEQISVRFKIKDTGLGISKEKQKIIFEPFKQASKNVTRKYGGTGLGLPIAKYLLKLHKSEIEIESSLNQGSIFSFDISFPKTQLPVHGSIAQSNLQTKNLNGLRILLAEDNEINMVFMKKLLSNWDVHLEIVKDGQKVIEALSKQDFDVILMDIHMPVMDGYTATQKIRNMEDPKKANIHIIALTASSSSEMENIKEKGMDDYLTKPFPVQTLKEKLNNIA